MGSTLGVHHKGTALMQFEDETLERIRVGVPDIFEGMSDRKRQEVKFEEKLKKGGFTASYSGAITHWKIGTI